MKLYYCRLLNDLFNCPSERHHTVQPLILMDAIVKKWISCIALLLLSNHCLAYTQPYHYRFWQGFRQQKLTAQDFADELNKSFIPATLKTGRGHGLNAYLPVLPKQAKPNFVPDEVALVVYKNRRDYLKLMRSKKGRAYQKTHWQLFTKKVSRSRIPMKFAKVVSVGSAYDLFRTPIDWQQQFIFLNIYARNSHLTRRQYQKGLAQYLAWMKRLNKDGLNADLMLVQSKYVLEFQAWSSQAHYERTLYSAPGQTSLKLLNRVTHPMQHLPIHRIANKLKYGMGVIY